MKDVFGAIEKADPRILEGESLTASVIVDATKDTFHFLEEVAIEIPYTRYFGRCKVQMFERMRALVLSDVFEDITDAAREVLVKPYKVEQLRGMDLYREMKMSVESAAERIAEESSPGQFLERVGMRTARSLARLSRQGSDRERVKAASEIFERQVPKISRGPTHETKVVVLSDKAAKTLREAFGESG